MTDKKYKIGIVGGGAVGLTYAAFLADHATVIVKTRRSEQADQIKAKGVSLIERYKKTTEKKESLKNNIDATASFADLAGCNGVIVTVKSYDTETVAKELSPVLKSNTEVLTLQNGLQAFDILKKNIKNPNRIFAGVAYIGATRLDNRSVSAGFNLRTIVDSNATILVQVLQSTRVAFESSTQINQAIWDKMVLNATQNALGAITNLTLGEMGKSEECLNIAQKLFNEIEKVANAEDVFFNYSFTDKIQDNWKMSKHHPSMWQDIQLKKKTEIEAINGAISALGKKHGIETPYNDMITSLIKIIEIHNPEEIS